MALLQAADQLGPYFPNNMPVTGHFDWQCSLIDAADLLKVDLESIPSFSSYLQPAPHLQDYWAKRLPKQPGVLRVGIAWQGNPDHQADIFRSIPLAYFQPLSQIPNVQLVSLQQGFGSQQLQDWQGEPIEQLEHSVDKSGGAFMDTAAIMTRSLDLVISSDTSIAHLSAALGVPTWIGLNYIPDWRWLLGRDDSPWYPCVRLFRQTHTGDWTSLFTRIKEALELLVRELQKPSAEGT
jgi:hypothetical protein